MFRETRWRLVAWNVVVIALVLAALGAAAYAFFASRLYSEVNQELSNQQNIVTSDLPHYQYNPSYLYSEETTLIQPPYRAVFTDVTGAINGSSECNRSVLT